MANPNWRHKMKNDDRINDVELAHTIAISWNYYYDEPRMDEDESELYDGDYTGCESYYWSMSSPIE